MILFEKVPFGEFESAVRKMYPKRRISSDALYNVYAKIKPPVRSTSGSAGYDFTLPFEITLKKGKATMFPTGIRCKMPSDVVLMLYPRSGLGTKYGIQLANTIGVIDSDYYNATNYGHIMGCITADWNRRTTPRKIELGEERVMQGVFTTYHTTADDRAVGIRTGGHGSTGK